MKRRFPWSMIALLVVCVGLATVIGRAVLAGPPTQPRAEDRAKAAREEKPPAGGEDERMPLPEAGLVGGNGIVEPADRESKLGAQVAGVVAALPVKEGQFVEKGAVLALLASEVERAAVAVAEAEVRAARGEVSSSREEVRTAEEDVHVADQERVRTEAGLRTEDVDAAKADAEAAEARAALSDGALARTERAAQGGAVTVDELERARRQAEIDRRSAKASRARAAGAVAGARAEDVHVAKGRVVAVRSKVKFARVRTRVATTRIGVAESKLRQAQAALDRLTVRAPTAGEVLQVKYRLGEYYNPAGQEPLIILGDTRHLRVRIDVYERDLAKVRMGARGYVVADGFPGRRFVGRVVEVGRRMGRKNVRTDDPVERIDTKILEVVLALERADGLVPGLRLMAYLEAAPVPSARPPATPSAPASAGGR